MNPFDFMYAALAWSVIRNPEVTDAKVRRAAHLVALEWRIICRTAELERDDVYQSTLGGQLS